MADSGGALAARIAELREKRAAMKPVYRPRVQIHRPGYKYTQYQTELAQGQFQATDDDLIDLTVVTHVDPIDMSQIVETSKIKSPQERQNEKLRKSLKQSQFNKLTKKVHTKARSSYGDAILSEFP